VRDLARVRDFYEMLLPAPGFTRKTEIPDWFQYEAAAPDTGPAAFFGVTESASHVPNENRIAFWAASAGRRPSPQQSKPAVLAAARLRAVGRDLRVGSLEHAAAGGARDDFPTKHHPGGSAQSDLFTFVLYRSL
jgi:hypothetical protein